MTADLEYNLAALVGTVRARDLVEKLARMGGATYRIGTRNTAADDIGRARQLLDAGMTRAEVRAVLMETRGMSRRTAYRRIAAALALRIGESRRKPCFGAHGVANGGGLVSVHQNETKAPSSAIVEVK